MRGVARTSSRESIQAPFDIACTLHRIRFLEQIIGLMPYPIHGQEIVMFLLDSTLIEIGIAHDSLHFFPRRCEGSFFKNW